MNLAIHTERGQEFTAYEEAMRLMWEELTGWQYISTPKHLPASVDAVLLDREGMLAGTAETKCREMTVEEFTTRHKEQWLVTFDKLCDGRRVSKGLGVPFYGFLYLVPSETLMVVRVSNEKGQFVVPMTNLVTDTKYDCNGGDASRYNAFVDMRKAKIFREVRTNAYEAS